MNYKLASDFWDEKEYDAIDRVVKSGFFTMGKEVEALEKKFAEYFGAKYCVMSNSGSSANLLAVAALVYSGKLCKGDEVIVPAVSWSTTYHPLYQYGLKLRFVDIDIDTLNYNIESLRDAITSETKMIMVVNLLGNNSEFSKINEICENNGIFYIEDNCESMGSQVENKYSGSFGLLGTFSSFYSHHIATMEGGYTITNDKNIYNFMVSIRAHGWTRGIHDDWEFYNKKSDTFYEKFNFILPGYNLRPLEIEAAIANVQLDKLSDIVFNRRRNARLFKSFSSKYKEMIFQKEIGESSWFGFSIVLAGKLKGRRTELVDFLENNNIETRPIVAGNFTRNDVIKYYEYSIYSELSNADYIHENGLFIGNNANDLEKEIEYLFLKIDEFLGDSNE